MEVQDFIESGKIELFILGILDPVEKEEVENMIQNYPEVRLEKNRIEASMEAFAQQEAVEPTNDLKEKIRSKLKFSSDTEQSFRSEINLNDLGILSNGVPLYPVRKSAERLYPYALAACVSLLIISGLSISMLYSRLNETRNNYSDLLNRSRQYGTQVAYFKTELNKSRIVMDDPDYRKLSLPGTKAHANSLAVVWWNRKKHTVMIDPLGLPSTDKNHSYQLWAIVNGKPVDAGVFEVNTDIKTVSQLKDIQSAQAFAVTLESKGGSSVPTMSEMYVMSSI